MSKLNLFGAWSGAAGFSAKNSAQSILNATAVSMAAASACGASGDKKPSACGAGGGDKKPSACGSGGGDKKPSACGSGGGDKKPSACGSGGGDKKPSACGAGGK